CAHGNTSEKRKEKKCGEYDEAEKPTRRDTGCRRVDGNRTTGDAGPCRLGLMGVGERCCHGRPPKHAQSAVSKAITARRSRWFRRGEDFYSTRTTSTDCLWSWPPEARNTPTIGEMSE